jgi:hypothetical protein
MSETSIFNERGVLRTDLHNVRVPPEQRPALDALVSAVMAAEEAERQFKIKDQAVADKVEAHARARAAYVPGTFMDEWKANVASYQKRRR